MLFLCAGFSLAASMSSVEHFGCSASFFCSCLHIFAFHEIVFPMYTIYVYHQIRAPNVSKRKKNAKQKPVFLSYGHLRRCGFCLCSFFFRFVLHFVLCVVVLFFGCHFSFFRENKAQRFLHSCRSLLLLLLFPCL